MRIHTARHLSRRTVLRGVGAALALPLLDSMLPAFATRRVAAAAPLNRLGIVYVPNGMWMRQWTPATPAAIGSEGLEITPLLETLRPFRNRMVLLTGLSNSEADQHVGEGAGDHARAAAAYLTGMHPRKTEGADLYCGVSMDQIAAREMGRQTQLSSLELSLESRETVGACDPGYSCAYANTLCWSSPATPLPMENDPRAVFERLFGSSDSTDRQARLTRIHEDKSILDAVNDKLRRLRADVPQADRDKLGQYEEAIRDVERRIARAEEQSDRALPVMAQPTGIPALFEEHAKLMYDLQVLAYQADLTRVISFMVGHESSTRAYPEIGVPDAHHPLSHHGGNQDKIAMLIKINQHHAAAFSYFLTKLDATPDGDGTLLDHLMLLYGSGMSDGNRHDHHDLPTLLVGGASGGLKGGRHIRYEKDTPIANLFLTLLDKLGVPADTLGDSNGRLRGLSDV